MAGVVTLYLHGCTGCGRIFTLHESLLGACFTCDPKAWGKRAGCKCWHCSERGAKRQHGESVEMEMVA